MNRKILKLRNMTTYSLPICQHGDEIISAINSYNFVVILSSTGSGKTTQLPQLLLNDTFLSKKFIAVTQPRRLAATTVASFVSSQVREGELGKGPIGYQIRFEAKRSSSTRVCFMTDGILIREAIEDPRLSKYGIIILDEAHERNINTDFLFGIVWRAHQLRRENHNPDLKIIVMSATLDPAPFVNFFGKTLTKVLFIEGKQYPIRVFNSQENHHDYVVASIATVFKIHNNADCPLNRVILVFLTSEEEIVRCCREINQRSSTCQNSIRAFPLYANLPQDRQQDALNFQDSKIRKVIVATNIAETSLTIEGVNYVIDCGYAKVPSFNPFTGLEILKPEPISKAQAWQRTGRAGRKEAGFCFRLYTEEDYNSRPLQNPPQILSSPIEGILLSLVSMGISKPTNFHWLTAPSQENILKSIKNLLYLQAVEITTEADSNSNHSFSNHLDIHVHRPLRLTEMGKMLSLVPLNPRLAHALLSGQKYDCLADMLTLVSMLYSSPVWLTNITNNQYSSRKEFYHPQGDLVSLILVYRGYLEQKKRHDLDSTRKWCYERGLNLQRLMSTVKVRTALKEILCALKFKSFKSCEKSYSKITDAFLHRAYRDQVVRLISFDLKNDKFPRYQLLRLCGNNNSNSFKQTLLIHPESVLYVNNSSNAPDLLLFIDASEDLINTSDSSLEFQAQMRICARIKNEQISNWFS